jgi:hypothetical protein
MIVYIPRGGSLVYFDLYCQMPTVFRAQVVCSSEQQMLPRLCAGGSIETKVNSVRIACTRQGLNPEISSVRFRSIAPEINSQLGKLVSGQHALLPAGGNKGLWARDTWHSGRRTESVEQISDRSRFMYRNGPVKQEINTTDCMSCHQLVVRGHRFDSGDD